MATDECTVLYLKNVKKVHDWTLKDRISKIHCGLQELFPPNKKLALSIVTGSACVSNPDPTDPGLAIRIQIGNPQSGSGSRQANMDHFKEKKVLKNSMPYLVF
jgi:hypothetical protein